MFTLLLRSTTFPAPKDSVEQIYSAVETNHSTGETLDLVCYRTADGKTRQAEVNSDGTFTERIAVDKMKK